MVMKRFKLTHVSAYLSSRVLLVERSEKFRAEITSPAFGSFAEGQSNVVSGYVSAQRDDGTSNAPTVVAVHVNGMTTTLSGGDWGHIWLFDIWLSFPVMGW